MFYFKNKVNIFLDRKVRIPLENVSKVFSFLTGAIVSKVSGSYVGRYSLYFLSFKNKVSMDT
ncbi:hypothetical protein AN964_21595 [Heyndrickxia shackletonii]|uniref:Uncharacterized protein n=1 Tax=Heyndrickxia shackletonii TaxID=157838 RepID=A0A0Q3WT11_9BACI|nr:hypothetical protein AN964_21595 [Heyndrickxia shackletonii]